MRGSKGVGGGEGVGRELESVTAEAKLNGLMAADESISD